MLFRLLLSNISPSFQGKSSVKGFPTVHPHSFFLPFSFFFLSFELLPPIVFPPLLKFLVFSSNFSVALARAPKCHLQSP